MLSNFWEEMNMPDAILKFHEEEMAKWNIPKWIANIKCPFCNKGLPLRSIRSISLKFNARNIGDIAVEVCCAYCSKMDTVYFRQEVNKITDIIPLLTGEKEPKNGPIIEEKMYKMQYNNLVEKMLGVQ